MSDKIKISCYSCGAPLSFDPLDEIAVCEYCGHSHRVSELLNENVELRSLKMQLNSKKELEEKRIEHEIVKDYIKRKKEEEDSTSSKGRRFRRSIFGIFLVVCILLSLLDTVIMFDEKKILIGVLSGIQLIILIVSWMAGSKIILAKKNGICALLGIIGVLLFVPVMTYGQQKVYEKYIWPNNTITERISKPKSNYGSIEENNDSIFEITIGKVTENYYHEYVEDCKTRGFILKQYTLGDRYEAYDSDEYKIEVDYNSSYKELDIKIIAPKKIEEFDWNKIVLSELIPNENFIGYIDNNSERSLFFTVYNTNKSEYDKYKAKCLSYGYVNDSVDQELSYEAYKEDGTELDLRYDNEWDRFSVRVEPQDMEYADIIWPKSDMVRTLPKPKSLYGYIYSESDKLFTVYLGNTSKDEYNDYVNKCIDKGYDVDYKKYDDSFYAKNKDGYSLRVSYSGYRTMEISINGYNKKD